MKNVWETLAEAGEANQVVQVGLTPALQVVAPKLPRGRPRSRPILPWSDYADYDPQKASRPRCTLKGCRRELRKDQKVACCPEHLEAVVDHAKTLLRRAG